MRPEATNTIPLRSAPQAGNQRAHANPSAISSPSALQGLFPIGLTAAALTSSFATSRPGTRHAGFRRAALPRRSSSHSQKVTIETRQSRILAWSRIGPLYRDREESCGCANLQRPLTPEVAGSSPVGPANQFNDLHRANSGPFSFYDVSLATLRRCSTRPLSLSKKILERSDIAFASEGS